jgi:tetratricopeptide (TPR) repeat protein
VQRLREEAEARQKAEAERRTREAAEESRWQAEAQRLREEAEARQKNEEERGRFTLEEADGEPQARANAVASSVKPRRKLPGIYILTIACALLGGFIAIVHFKLGLKSQGRRAPEPAVVSTNSLPLTNTSGTAAQTPAAFTASSKGTIDRETAQGVSRRLKALGYEPHLSSTKTDHETWYRIELGPFGTAPQASAAQKALDGLEARPQLDLAPSLPMRPSAVPSPRLATVPKAPKPKEARYTVQSDETMDYYNAIAMLINVEQLGYLAHLVPTTVNGQQQYRIDVGPLSDKSKAAQVRKTLHQLAIQSHPTGSVRQPEPEALQSLAVASVNERPEVRANQQKGEPYRIQIEDTADYTRAQMIMRTLRRLRYAPTMTPITEGRQTSYHIEIGGFASQDDAEAAQDELNDKYNAELKVEHPESLKRAAPVHSELPTELASREPAVEKPSAAPPVQQEPSPSSTSNAIPAGRIEFSSEPQKPGDNPSHYAASSYYDQGDDLLAKNNLDEASSHFRQAVALDPTMADAFYAWGLTLYAQHDLDGAIAKFRKATSLKPTYANAYYNWGLALSRRGDFESAIPKFEQATRLKPDYADAYYAWGVALYHQHKVEESVVKYRKALELRPKNDTYRRALESALAAEHYSSPSSLH